jgi:hypothetical protein
VGFYGYPQNNNSTTPKQHTDYLFQEEPFKLSLIDINHNANLDAQGPLLLRGAEYVFSWVDKQLTNSVNILVDTANMPLDTTTHENLLLSLDSNLIILFLTSFLLDTINVTDLLNTPFISSWYNYVTRATANIVFTLEHPEVLYFSKEFSIFSTAVSDSLWDFALKHEYILEQLATLLFFFFDILWKLGFVSVIIVCVFNIYNNNYDSNGIDTEFLLNSLAIESEEEIASVEDTVVLLIIVLFVFGWFFFFTYINILTLVGDIMCIFIFIPLLMYILFFIPIYLLWDYGMHFLTYLRGASSTSALAMEFVYDCIAFLAFFIRLGVQNVRLLLITLTFFSLYEFILFFVNVNWFYSNFEQLNKLIATSNGSYTSYYYFMLVITKAVYWIYELLHTFFVTIAQFVAFFAMVFWLFLFLYTMFVVDEFEKYLDEKRRNIK